MLNFEVLNVRASSSVTARTDAVEKFNDKTDKVDFLVTSMELSSYGLNLQKACRRGVFVQFTFSSNAVLQAICRLIRPGQEGEVEWGLLKCGLTYNDYQEADMAAKFIHQLKLEGRIPESINHLDNFKVNYAYDNFREIFGQPYSIAQFHFKKPSDVSDFYTGEQHKVGA
jgi:hypothetical protein